MTTTMDHVSPPPTPGAATPASEPQDAPPKAEKRPLSPAKRLAMIAGAALLVIGAVAYWYQGTFFEDTDDAQIDGYISNVASRVGGTVTAVLVDDNQAVKPNQVLVELDPTDLRVARDWENSAADNRRASLLARREHYLAQTHGRAA